MSDGKLGTAPCGHPGRAVLGQFYLCTAGCDAPPKANDPVAFEQEEPTNPDARKCPRCGSLNTAPFWHYFSTGDQYNCLPCGHVFHWKP